MRQAGSLCLLLFVHAASGIRGLRRGERLRPNVSPASGPVLRHRSIDDEFAEAILSPLGLYFPPPEPASPGSDSALAGEGGRVNKSWVIKSWVKLCARSEFLRKESLRLGVSWVKDRWRPKLGYLLLGAFAARVGNRAIRKLQANIFTSPDIYLDVEDADYLNRGVILELQGHELLSRLALLDPLEGSAQVYWSALKATISKGLLLRCRPQRRSSYPLQLGRAMRVMVRATEGMGPDNGGEIEGDLSVLPDSHKEAVGEALLLCEVRLCDAELRIARDALLAGATELKQLLRFWEEKMSLDSRMNVIRGLLLGVFVYSKVAAGKRLAVQGDQQRVVSIELLLDRYLNQLGRVQKWLASKPRDVGLDSEQATLWRAWSEGGVSLLMEVIKSQEAPATSNRNEDVAEPEALELAVEEVAGEEIELLEEGSSDTSLVTPPKESSWRDALRPCIKRRPWFRSAATSEDLLQEAPNHPERNAPELKDCKKNEDEEEEDDEEEEETLWADLPCNYRQAGFELEEEDEEDDPLLPAASRLVRQCSTVSRLPRTSKAHLEGLVVGAGGSRPAPKRFVLISAKLAALPISYRAAKKVYTRREELQHVSKMAREAIVNGVVFRTRAPLFDAGALADARLSLMNMLDTFIKDTTKLSKEERESLVSSMDMSVVSRRLEKEAPATIRNILSGRIARMMLIQSQFIKKELMVAMRAIDDLYNANQVNLQLFAVFPAFLFSLLVYLGIKNIFYTVSSRRFEPTAMVHTSMRQALREVERLLTNSSGMRDGGELSQQELGWLALRLQALQALLSQNASRFDRGLRRRLEQDIRDLTRSGVNVSQQIAVVHRIQNSYSFLRPGQGRRRGLTVTL